MRSLTIVIIEYHCLDDVVIAVESAKKHLSEIDYELIVVSNSLYDDVGIKKLHESLPGIKIIINEVNGGYAGGVNRALKDIDSSYIFLLNPDAQFIDSGLKLLIDEMDKNKKLAAIGPKVVDEDGAVQPSCRRFPRPYTFLLVRSFLSRLPGANKERVRYLMEDFDHEGKRLVDWVSGGAMLVRVATIKEVGGMDERYFLYVEDVDWCKTMGQAGWKVLYDPRSTIMHAGRHSSISNGLRSILTSTTRWHLTSLWKFFCKWGLFSK